MSFSNSGIFSSGGPGAGVSVGTVNLQSDDYVLALADAGGLVSLNKASAISATVPNNSAIAFKIGTQINVMQYGVGVASIVAAGGVTIRYTSLSLNLGAQYAIVTLIKIATNEWVAVGQLS